MSSHRRRKKPHKKPSSRSHTQKTDAQPTQRTLAQKITQLVSSTRNLVDDAVLTEEAENMCVEIVCECVRRCEKEIHRLKTERNAWQLTARQTIAHLVDAVEVCLCVCDV